jgi:peptidoglycan/LPS O-acetylase OafA/YrhL
MKDKLDHIDTLRGIAVLMVVLIHTGQCINNLPVHYEKITEYGQLGVQLFFFVSAFTLCLSFDGRKGEVNGVIKFYIRRFFRIAPLYYFGIMAYFLIRVANDSFAGGGLIIPERYLLSNILSNIIFIHGFIPSANNSIVPGGWSIGAEMIFYALFPILFIFARLLMDKKINYFILFLALTLALSMLIQGSQIFSVMQLSDSRFMYYNVSNQLPVFVTGMFLYYLYKNKQLSNIDTPKALLLFLVFVFIALCLYKFKIPYSITLMPFFIAQSFVFLYVLTSRYRALNPRYLRRVGELSFSIYIIHFFLTRLFGGILSQFSHLIDPLVILFVSFFLVVSVSCYLGHWTLKYIELPGMKLGHKLVFMLDQKTLKQNQSNA